MRLALHVVAAVLLFRASRTRPPLTGKGRVKFERILFPPCEVTGINDVGPRSGPESRVDRYDFARGLRKRSVDRAPLADVLDVGKGEAGSACEADDGGTPPSSGAFPALVLSADLFCGVGAALLAGGIRILCSTAMPLRINSAAWNDVVSNTVPGIFLSNGLIARTSIKTP